MDLNVTVEGLRVLVSEKEIADYIRQRLLGKAAESRTELPKIGDYWAGQGGIFTGLVCPRGTVRPQAVITATLFDADKWEAMKAKAAAVEVDGHKDFRLPYRNEQLLQWENIPDLFKKECYWSIEPYAGVESFAWFQDFIHGSQGDDPKVYELFGCAVRSFPI